MAYGAGLKKIAESTGIALEVVEAMAKAEAENYPELGDFFKKTVTAAVEESVVPSKTYCRHPNYPSMTLNLGTGFYRTPDGKLYAFQEEPAPEYLVKRGVSKSVSPTQIMNYPVQGTGAEFAKAGIFLAVWLFWRHDAQLKGRAKLTNQVHDASYADADGSVAVTAAAMLEAAMLEANTFIEFLFNWRIEAPVPTETVMGESMAVEKHIDDPKFPGAVQYFRNLLRAEVMRGFVPSFN